MELSLGRPWRWLRVRILGLLSKPPTVAPDGTLIPATRLALALFPPNQQQKRR